MGADAVWRRACLLKQLSRIIVDINSVAPWPERTVGANRHGDRSPYGLMLRASEVRTKPADRNPSRQRGDRLERERLARVRGLTAAATPTPQALPGYASVGAK